MSRVIKVKHYVSDWVLIAAAVAVTRKQGVRLSKSAVMAQAAEWYEIYGSQLDAGDYQDVNEDAPETKEYDRALAWVRKYWPEVKG